MLRMPSGVTLPRMFRVLLAAGICLAIAAPTAAHTVRGHTARSHRHTRGSWGGGWYYGPGYSYWYSPWYGYYGSWGYGPGYGLYPYGSYPYVAGRPDVAFIDTDIQPEETAVYVDGEYQGTVDDFDGFPEYLSIAPGRHTIIFKADGYRTVTRSVRVPRGAVLQMDFSLSRGEGEEPVPEGQKEEIVIPEQGEADQQGRRGEVSLERERGSAGSEDAGAGEPGDDTDPGFIRLRVSPADASVYLDGELLGSASRLSRLHGDLRLEPGEHRIEVVRPGYRALRRVVTIAPGERRSLDLDLQRSGEAPRSD